MSEILSSAREIAATLRDVGLIIGVPILVAVGWKLYKQLVDNLRAEIDLLRLTQYDQALKQIRAQKELYQIERDRLEREIVELQKRGAERKGELSEANQSLTLIQRELETLRADRATVADHIHRVTQSTRATTVSRSVLGEALRKLSHWCRSDNYGSPGTVVPGHLFASSSYGVVGVNQVEQEVMIKNGWIEEVDDGVRITELGRERALRVERH